MNPHGWSLLSLCLLVGACAKGPSQFDRMMDQAQEKSRQGQHAYARQLYERAHQAATSQKDAMEARYRAAGQLSRQDRYLEAAEAFRQLAHDIPDGPRAARAWLDAGRAFERANEQGRARQAYAMLMKVYPHARLWLRAAERHVALAKEPEVEAWRKLLVQAKEEHAPAVHHRLAQAYERLGNLRDALRHFEASVRLAPMPRGVHADDALLKIAELRRALGDMEGALRAVNLLLENRSAAGLVGSYERPTFARGQMLRGYILRDDLGQQRRAAEEFVRVARNHPTSRLRDDGLWQAAWTYHAVGAAKDACSVAKTLEATDARSRYVPCLGLVCDAFGQPAATDQRRCERALSEVPDTPRKR